jgi:demethylmenaquinone methyltransferase/2-methoxy-6-polyprenyl-1,4-benzoquinol methylase
MSLAIKRMFDKIAPKYDIGNTVFSLGIHHLWRKKTAEKSGIMPNSKILDCATGTGDLYISFQSYYKNSKIIGIDFSKEMLDIASNKLHKIKMQQSFIQGDIMQLPFNGNFFDAITISFGIRNVDNIVSALKEMARVLKPNGKIIVLEFGQPSNLIIESLYNLYCNCMTPIAKLIFGKRGAYDYLLKSTRAFPCREKFIKLMDETNSFVNCTYKTFSCGISYLYMGIKK